MLNKQRYRDFTNVTFSTSAQRSGRGVRGVRGGRGVRVVDGGGRNTGGRGSGRGAGVSGSAASRADNAFFEADGNGDDEGYVLVATNCNLYNDYVDGGGFGGGGDRGLIFLILSTI